jgi:hypothetical protein
MQPIYVELNVGARGAMATTTMTAEVFLLGKKPIVRFGHRFGSHTALSTHEEDV